MLMFVLLFDLIIFLASASKFLGLSLAHALSRLSVGKNTNGICVFFFFFHQQNGLIWKLVQT